MLADTDVPIAVLDELAAVIIGDALSAAVRCAAAGCATRNMTSMIQNASARISSLIAAVKGFTHMDQANTAELVELGPHLKKHDCHIACQGSI